MGADISMSLRDSALQINMHPNDVRHVVHILPHQIRVWGQQVGKVVVILDLHRSRAGRYRNDQFDHNLAAIRTVLNDLKREVEFDVVDVDYSPAVKREVARAFFSVDDIPDKAWDGGPFYSYFFGLWAARANHIVHADSDMLFGGRDPSWFADAIALLEARPDLLFVAPLSGPPRPDAALIGQKGWESGAVRRDETVQAGYLFPSVSTRIFIASLSLLRQRVGALDLIAPTPLQKLRSHILGNPPRAIEAESLLSRFMTANELFRLDVLGRGHGMWSLHPPYRSEAFYAQLPHLIEQIEQGQVPPEQRGRYDVHDSMVDWSEQRRMNTQRHRWGRQLKQMRQRIVG